MAESTEFEFIFIDENGPGVLMLADKSGIINKVHKVEIMADRPFEKIFRI